MKDIKQLNLLAIEFHECQKVLAAIGDETRHNIILTLIAAGCDGIRVGDITQKTHLSRPAVSHHLRILKEAKVVNVHRVGTKNFYYIDPQNNSIYLLKNLINHMEEYIKNHWDTPKEDY
ncbi:metalloregulator ArsR/SmtB family transcription factor [Priestia megaterium]|uniref:ArsR/SmtB family transcription factor n=1 Tax=Priestia megaterium TaxID=1404 RepID=UPI003D0532EB